MEQLAVVASGGSYDEGKLLSAIPVQDGTGSTIAANVMKTLIEDWSLENFVKALVFDTTSSNTCLLYTSPSPRD